MRPSCGSWRRTAVSAARISVARSSLLPPLLIAWPLRSVSPIRWPWASPGEGAELLAGAEAAGAADDQPSPSSRTACSSRTSVATSVKGDGRLGAVELERRRRRGFPIAAPTHVLQADPTSQGRPTSLIQDFVTGPAVAVSATKLHTAAIANLDDDVLLDVEAAADWLRGFIHAIDEGSEGLE